ncbi:MAG: hypothetical protein A4E67_01975 [Syntrophaceae bacterium PtaB.Bin038]|nr:MAG: hypothetical protein A4E67_01975 [Syntrophaceae bacterium PtaB.Bin038]
MPFPKISCFRKSTPSARSASEGIRSTSRGMSARLRRGNAARASRESGWDCSALRRAASSRILSRSPSESVDRSSAIRRRNLASPSSRQLWLGSMTEVRRCGLSRNHFRITFWNSPGSRCQRSRMRPMRALNFSGTRGSPS